MICVIDFFYGAGGFIFKSQPCQSYFFSFENIVQLKNKNTIFRSVNTFFEQTKTGQYRDLVKADFCM